jgi:hypothetical protein
LIAITIGDIPNILLALLSRLCSGISFSRQVGSLRLFIQSPSKLQTTPVIRNISFPFHLKKISAVSVLGISDSIRSDMIKLQVGLPGARPENRCNRPLEGRKFIDGMQA